MADFANFRIEVFPSDLNRFVDFYVGVLRFELVDDRRADPSPHAAVQRGTIRIGAVPAWKPTEATHRAVPQGVELVFEVDDLVAERNAIHTAGWPLDTDITERPWGLSDFRLFDPDGHYIRFTTK